MPQKIEGGNPRPTCIRCGRAFGSRYPKTETRVWPADEPRPEFPPTNGIVTSEIVTTFDGYQREDGKTGRLITRRVWDGKWYGGQGGIFCSVACATAVAVAAIRSGFDPKES